MKTSTRSLTNMECLDAYGMGIADSILQEFQKRGIGREKITSLGSDGALVMKGKNNGCAAIMMCKTPHMYNVNGVAQRLALCTLQATEHIPQLKQHQQILTDLFYYFKSSEKRAGMQQQVQEIVEDPMLTIEEIHYVRWLSYFNALTTVFRTLDSLLTYLAECPLSDPKARGLKKKVKLELCVKDLEVLKALDTPHLKKLTEDLSEDGTFKQKHHITTSNFQIQKIADEFADSLIANIKSKFPNDERLTAFFILSIRHMSFLDKHQLEEYGQD